MSTKFFRWNLIQDQIVLSNYPIGKGDRYNKISPRSHYKGGWRTELNIKTTIWQLFSVISKEGRRRFFSQVRELRSCPFFLFLQDQDVLIPNLSPGRNRYWIVSSFLEIEFGDKFHTHTLEITNHFALAVKGYWVTVSDVSFSWKKKKKNVARESEKTSAP